jgi:hypothetical protein
LLLLLLLLQRMSWLWGVLALTGGVGGPRWFASSGYARCAAVLSAGGMGAVGKLDSVQQQKQEQHNCVHWCSGCPT